MSDAPENLVLTLLRDLRTRMDERFDGIEKRLKSVERVQGENRDLLQQVTGMTLLNANRAEAVDQRIEEAEDRITALENAMRDQRT